MYTITDLSGRLIGTTDVAARLGCSTKHVSSMIRAGKLPAIETRLGRLLLVDDVEKIASERESAAKDVRGHIKVVR